jgi:hypothetical protein
MVANALFSLFGILLSTTVNIFTDQEKTKFTPKYFAKMAGYFFLSFIALTLLDIL